MFDKEIIKLPGAKVALVICVLLSIVRSLLIIGQAIFLSIAIVDVWDGGAIVDQILYVALFALCFIGRETVSVAQSIYMEKYAHERVEDIRKNLLRFLYDNGASMKAEYGTAAIVTTLVDGTEQIENHIALIVPKTVALVVVPLCLIIAIFTQDLVSGFIVLVCYPFIIIFMRLIGYTASDESAKRHDGFMRMSNHFLDSLRGMETLKAFGVSKGYSKSIFLASERYREQIMRTLRIAQLSGAVLDLFATCGLAAVAIMLGFRLVEGSIAFLPALIVLMLVPEYFLPIKRYAADYHASLDGKTALASAAIMADVSRRSIDLGNICANIEPGETVVVTGSTGAGKTTFLDSISGMIDCECEGLTIDGMRDSGFADKKWQQRIAYIPQEPSIFNGTLRDNVCFYAPYATDKDVEDALRSVGLDELLKNLPDGLDERIGRGGRALSDGEKHRVAIARALVDAKRDIWLLDEPGSNLDIETEYELKQSILPLMEDRTVIVSTHRAHWLADADRHIAFEVAGN